MFIKARKVSLPLNIQGKTNNQEGVRMVERKLRTTLRR